MPPNKKKTARKPKEDNRAESREKPKGKKNTSLRLDKQTLKALKIHAIENETSIQNLIESLIKDYLEGKSHDK
jgi:hypothetical protein